MSEDATIPHLLPSVGKSESERAAEYKARMAKALIEVCALMDESLKDGLLIRWANIALGPYGRHEVVDLHIEKRF